MARLNVRNQRDLHYSLQAAVVDGNVRTRGYWAGLRVTDEMCTQAGDKLVTSKSQDNSLDQ